MDCKQFISFFMILLSGIILIEIHVNTHMQYFRHICSTLDTIIWHRKTNLIVKFICTNTFYLCFKYTVQTDSITVPCLNLTFLLTQYTLSSGQIDYLLFGIFGHHCPSTLYLFWFSNYFNLSVTELSYEDKTCLISLVPLITLRCSRYVKYTI